MAKSFRFEKQRWGENRQSFTKQRCSLPFKLWKITLKRRNFWPSDFQQCRVESRPFFQAKDSKSCATGKCQMTKEDPKIHMMVKAVWLWEDKTGGLLFRCSLGCACASYIVKTERFMHDYIMQNALMQLHALVSRDKTNAWRDIVGSCMLAWARSSVFAAMLMDTKHIPGD